jgi:N-acetylglucosaminyldiphosphoundecaprenol N-acetyl-beta-D-mannosaminyltransferase
MQRKQGILGVGITNDVVENILYDIYTGLKIGKKFFIVTPNPEILVYANKHVSYKNILNTAEIALPDGVGVFIAGGLLGKAFKERIPGVDFIEELCKFSEENPMSMGFLGGGKGVAKRTADCLKKKYPWITIGFAGEEWPEGMEIGKMKNKFLAPNSQSATLDILFVAYGFPKQEEWISEHLHKLPVICAMGVGGAFDYISGDVMRAPYMIRAIGFEWLFRLIRQPWRLKRQFALLQFVYFILQEQIKKLR